MKWLILTLLLAMSATLRLWKWRRDETDPAPDWSFAIFETIAAFFKGATLFALLGPPIGWSSMWLVMTLGSGSHPRMGAFLFGAFFSYFLAAIPAAVTGALVSMQKPWIRRLHHCLLAGLAGCVVTTIFVHTFTDGRNAFSIGSVFMSMATAFPATVICTYLFARTPARQQDPFGHRSPGKRSAPGSFP